MKRAGWLLGVLLILSGCYEEVEQVQEPVRQPKKEDTWVKTEKVELTKEKYLAQARQVEEKIPANEELKSQLLNVKADPSGNVKDEASCLEAVKPLDKKRKALQRSGGMWHAFERTPILRPYSNNGMQIDSHLNTLVFSLIHLCKTAEGKPMPNIAYQVSKLLDEKSEEETRHYLLDQGRAPKDVDKWIAYAKESREKTKRQVDFATIEGLIQKVQPLIELYDDLYQRKIDESTKNAFLADASALLEVIHARQKGEAPLTMAMKEDLSEPHHKYEGEM